MDTVSVKPKYTFKVAKTTESRLAQTDFNDLVFGRVFSDHLFIMDFVDGEWQQGNIQPFGSIPMHPASNVLHYGQAIFEGTKAFKLQDGTPALFRIEEHARRLNASAHRLCMAEIPEDLFVESIKQLVSMDRDWIPSFEGSSLYIRPFMIGMDGFLGVRPSKTYRFMVFTCPVGPYYSKPVSLVTSDQYVRAVQGGVGEAKAAGNYAASMLPMQEANDAGYDQVMWLDAKEHRYIQEVGTMNLFFVVDGKVLTPATDGAILKGITRKSFLEMLKFKGMEVEERPVTIDEILEAHQQGRLDEVFGTGTAAVVSPVSSITHKGHRIVLPDASKMTIATMLKKELNDIRTGQQEDVFGWLTPL